MMGYAKTSQSTRGIHTRLFARAFMFENVIENATNTGKEVLVERYNYIPTYPLKLHIN